MGFFYRIEPTIRHTLAIFFRKLVGQVHQLYAPRCGKTRIVACGFRAAFATAGGALLPTSVRLVLRDGLKRPTSETVTWRMPTNLLHHGP